MTATATTTTAIEKLNRVFSLQQKAYLNNPYPTAKERIELMNRVPDMLKKYRYKIHEALHADFEYHSPEMADLFEIVGMFERAKYNVENIKKWMKPLKKQGNPVTQGGSRQYVKYHPKGVIGNMVSWNFPFDIAIGPMLDQLGAGNRVIIKPSDLSPACGAVLEEMIGEYFNEDQVAVVNGDLELAKYFPTLPWNHLCYTGSGQIGKLVMKAAAENLTPVTLELGGKNPTIVAPDAVNEETAAMIARIKVVKRGQICVTTDHVLVPEAQKEAFIKMTVDYMRQHFAEENARQNSCGIITQRHLDRLQNLVTDARQRGLNVYQIGANTNGTNRDMPFYVIDNPPMEAAVMQEEIFGPILPILTYKNIEEAIDFVNSGDRPFGLYIYAQDTNFVQQITKNTASGGVAVNVVGLQAAQPSMGFGGVGASGMGRHHGIEGFREFSYPRGYFEAEKGGVLDWLMPPYGERTRQFIEDVAYAPFGQQIKFALKRLPNILFKK